jgi:hypothetical protein
MALETELQQTPVLPDGTGGVADHHYGDQAELQATIS